ncbi:fasciclin domain-containing protein [Flavobacteriaceae bacterium]|nr:fasciclin domain-containing protein [Flavobacteriaceae bacterium]MDC0117529.1 fasciclin domain-containing protein [Flavobacteriaceae bacterium]
MIKNLKLFTLLFLTLTIHSCSNNDDDDYVMQPKTIFGHVATSTNYMYLTSALQKTNLAVVLDGVEEYTLYAPNDMAFARFLMQVGYNNLDEVPTELLTQILLNHVMVGGIEYRDFVTGYFQTAATSAASKTPLSIHIEQVNMRVTLNGESRITQGNVRATNGIIHAVDRVVPIPSIVTFAKADTGLTNLLIALTRPDLTADFASILSTNTGTSPAPFTVFAPTDQAFEDLLTELGVAKLSDIDEPTLKATLTYHVIGETNALSTDLSDNLELNTLGGPITANITGGATLTDGNNRVSKIIAVDVQANNGVIHVIDKVILPN